MRYSTSVVVTFTSPPEEVFHAMTNMDMMLLWNTGMTNLTGDGMLKKGTKFSSHNVVMGQEFVTEVEVVAFRSNQLLEMASASGGINYLARFELDELPGGGTSVAYTLDFEPKSIVLNLASSIIGEIARTRLEADLQQLRALVDSKDKDTN